MAKFKFRLATLLRIRETTRDERRMRLAQAHEADDRLKQEQERLELETTVMSKYRSQTMEPGTVDVERLLAAQRYEIVLRAQHSQIRQQREMVGTEIQRRRESLVLADREVRVLEKLEEKLSQRHREEENRRENKEMDEIGQRRVRREAVQ